MKTYKDLMSFPTYAERLAYLSERSSIGIQTFGADRYLNQSFYSSLEWKKARRQAILRDNGTDMGLKDMLINGQIIVHHINPITVQDIENCSSALFDLNNLICVSKETHNKIHYGESKCEEYVERKPFDTIPWR